MIDLWSAGCTLIESIFRISWCRTGVLKLICVSQALTNFKLFLMHDVTVTYFGTLHMRQAISQLVVQVYFSVRTFST